MCAIMQELSGQLGLAQPKLKKWLFDYYRDKAEYRTWEMQ